MREGGFPENFLWGAATSSHQVEGDNRNNDWWEWEKQGRTAEPSGKACDHYNLFREDFKLAKEIGHNAHRFSLEWSRIEPREGIFDETVLDHYKEVVQTLRSLGIEPIVTLNHFTLPLWFAEKGGWLDERSDYIFARFAERAARHLGQNVKYWITLNEPLVYTYYSYIEGTWPPGKKSLQDAVKVFIVLLKAHALAYRAIHSVYEEKNRPRPMVGVAKYVMCFFPCRRFSLADNFSAGIRHYYFNKAFIASLLNGWCAAPGMPLVRLPSSRTLDFIGINYYTRDFIHFGGSGPNIFGDACTLRHHENAGKRNSLRWEIYPKGIHDVLMEFSRYGLGLFVTENGICTDDDNERTEFIKGHICEVKRALEGGARIIGYLYWSLMDNFEWTHGFRPKFGLIGVDRQTGQRAVRPSAHAYAEIIRKAREVKLR